MARKKNLSDKKQQLGQFMTPSIISSKIVDIEFNKSDKILEPSFGDGSFIISLIEKFIPLYKGNINDKLDYILNYNIHGYEIDEFLYEDCLNRIVDRWEYIPPSHNLKCQDYLTSNIRTEYDYIIGNPPFGGTIDKFSNDLEFLFGRRGTHKIRKETYSYFIVKSIELLSEGGKLIFICSDTFKTIKTMSGLRRWILSMGSVKLNQIKDFSEETNYPMVIFEFELDNTIDHILSDDIKIQTSAIESTPNFSWSIDSDIALMFKGKTIGDYMVCSGGLTTGKNEYFVRDIIDNKIVEEYKFTYYDELISLQSELEKAKDNILSKKRISSIKNSELIGETRINVSIDKIEPSIIQLPNDKYKYYNISTHDILWSNPTKAIYWDDDGEAVRTFKLNGNWYLHGFGGEKFFNKEGMTWQLIATRIKSRYLPCGYIIDNGSPVGVLRDNINPDELYFIIGWTLSSKCNDILKKVLNHTNNIQSKDIERLPYPDWISEENKKFIINFIKENIDLKMNNINVGDSVILSKINEIF